MFKLTYGDLKAAARINESRGRMVRENYFPAERFQPMEYVRPLATLFRTPDGSGNDPIRPTMGQSGRAFSRNCPDASVLASSPSDGPDPRVVSARLLHRDDASQELAPGINMLCAAWIQFQVHDWFDHDIDPVDSLSLNATTDLDALRVGKTRQMGTVPGGQAPVYGNVQGHWWDGSQLYGRSREQVLALRARKGDLVLAELALTPGGLLPIGRPMQEHGVKSDAVELSGFVKNWWIGLSALHTLFAREHNAIVGKLRDPTSCASQEHEDTLFERARLVNCALIAKIHTTEWSTAMLDTATMKLGLYANWWGVDSSDAGALFNVFVRFQQANGLADDDVLTKKHIEAIQASLPEDRRARLDPLAHLVADGTIPNRVTPAPREAGADGSPLDYAMSEEFVAVYRMHPLLVDPMPMRHFDGAETESLSLDKISLANARSVIERYKLSGVLYSLGCAAPAALRLRNYPATLGRLRIPGSEGTIDLAAVDILRDRERGIPRYLEFKRRISKQPGPGLGGPVTALATFTDICGDPNAPGIDAVEQARRLRDVELLTRTYASPEHVDLLVGMLAEPLPPGFAFSWTAFEVFVLMSVYRLSVDRFFTTDYREAVYKADGIAWINDNNMRSVLERHLPGFTNVLHDVGADGLPANPFRFDSWKRACPRPEVVS